MFTINKVQLKDSEGIEIRPERDLNLLCQLRHWLLLGLTDCRSRMLGTTFRHYRLWAKNVQKENLPGQAKPPSKLPNLAVLPFYPVLRIRIRYPGLRFLGINWGLLRLEFSPGFPSSFFFLQKGY